MTVKELIEELSTLPQDAGVWLPVGDEHWEPLVKLTEDGDVIL